MYLARSASLREAADVLRTDRRTARLEGAMQVTAKLPVFLQSRKHLARAWSPAVQSRPSVHSSVRPPVPSSVRPQAACRFGRMDCGPGQLEKIAALTSRAKKLSHRLPARQTKIKNRYFFRFVAWELFLMFYPVFEELDSFVFSS